MATALKNAIIPGAGIDLGLGMGDQLQGQVEDQLDEQKKKQAQQKNVFGAVGDLGLNVVAAGGGIFGAL